MTQLPLLVDNLINWYIWKAKIKECNQEYHIYYRPFYPYIPGHYYHGKKYFIPYYEHLEADGSHNTNIEEGICRILYLEKNIKGMIRINSRKLQNNYTDYEGEQYCNKLFNDIHIVFTDLCIRRFVYSEEFISIYQYDLESCCKASEYTVRKFVPDNYKYSCHQYDVNSHRNVRVIYPD
jgi:hypothetical protein